MRAQRLTDRRTGLRAGALLLICVLALALATAGTAGRAHKHPSRNAAVLAATGFDTAHASARHDAPALVPAAAPLTPPGGGSVGTSDSSTPVIARTAQAPQVRGPPAQAAA